MRISQANPKVWANSPPIRGAIKMIKIHFFFLEKKKKPISTYLSNKPD